MLWQGREQHPHLNLRTVAFPVFKERDADKPNPNPCSKVTRAMKGDSQSSMSWPYQQGSLETPGTLHEEVKGQLTPEGWECVGQAKAQERVL